jgi:hypothetical protein
VKPHISYRLVRDHGFIPDSRVKLQNLCYSLAGANPFGQASKALLKIQGPCVEAKQSKAYWYQQTGFEINDKPEIDKREVRTLQFRGDEGTMNADVTNTEAALSQWPEYGLVYCFMLGSTAKTAGTLQGMRLWHNEMLKPAPHDEALDIALVLQRVKDNPRVYERTGIIGLSRRSNWFQDAPLVTVYIR